MTHSMEPVECYYSLPSEANSFHYDLLGGSNLGNTSTGRLECLRRFRENNQVICNVLNLN